MDSIGPFWDGNEIWPVVFGGALFAAFPAAYAAMTALYLPMMLLLVALVFRAVSIEFRHHAWPGLDRRAWDFAFRGEHPGDVPLRPDGRQRDSGCPTGPDGEFRGELADLVRPYPILVGLFAVSDFAMHGAAYLRLRTSGALLARVGRWAWWSFVLFLATTAATLALIPDATANLRRHPWLWAVPVLNALAVANIPRALHRGRPREVFFSTGATIVAFTVLFGSSLYPNLISSTLDPAHDLTIRSASSSRGTLRNLLIVVGLGMPFVVSYTAVTYWVFRKPSRPTPHPDRPGGFP